MPETRPDLSSDELLPGWPEERVEKLAGNFLAWAEALAAGRGVIVVEPRDGGGWNISLGEKNPPE